MDEAIKLLREQTILCSRLTELLDKLVTSLKDSSHDTAELVQKIEPLVTDLSKNAANGQQFLEKSNFKNFGEFVNAAEEGVQKDVAMRLLQQVSSLQEKLTNGLQVSAELLKSGASFVAFNMNVLSQTSANPTYGAGATTSTNINRRIFDANI